MADLTRRFDGHDPDALSAALLLAERDPRPSMIACSTLIGRGLPGIEDTRAAHSARLLREHTDAARRYLDWPHPPFVVPDDVLAAWREASRMLEDNPAREAVAVFVADLDDPVSSEADGEMRATFEGLHPRS